MSAPAAETQAIYGLMAEFESPERLLEATRGAYAQGYRKMEAYTPFPVDGLAEALDFHHSRVPAIVFSGGLLGGLTGYFMQWYSAVVSYPINVGGRPLHSWPAFIPITFEMTVLGAAIAAVLGMLALNGLPRPHHPVFNAAGFELASNNRFFLCIQARDPLFDPERTSRTLTEFNAKVITAVPW
jgi:hypothetical protein